MIFVRVQSNGMIFCLVGTFIYFMCWHL